MVKIRATFLLLVACALPAAGCRVHSDSKVQDAASASSGGTLSQSFELNCARCHGLTGKGLIGPALAQYDFGTILSTVRSGIGGGVMPAFTETDYPTTVLQADAAALAGGNAFAPSNAVLPSYPPEIVGTPADQLASASHYTNQSNGPKALFGLFGLEPFVLPYVKCMNLPDINNPGTKSYHCANAIISGSTDEGYHFADFGICKDIRTQRPFNPTELPSSVRTIPNDPRLQDAAFMKELNWVTSQIRSSGCVCCHDSSIDKKVAYWDISAPIPIWTDQLNAYAIEVFTGRVDSTALGAVPLQLNHGFDRTQVGLPTTDSVRMKAFFMGLAQKKGTTAAEISGMAPLADVLASQLRNKPEACPDGVGVYADNSIHWSYVDWYHLGDVITNTLAMVRGQTQPKAILADLLASFSQNATYFQQLSPIARYVYILRPDSVTPLVPPNLDRPAGMIWRLDRDRIAIPFVTGLLHYPTSDAPLIPPAATQAFPEDGSLPEPLVQGQQYYLDAQIDMAFPAARCIFTYPAG